VTVEICIENLIQDEIVATTTVIQMLRTKRSAAEEEFESIPTELSGPFFKWGDR
jgi:hypothetical protein